MAHQEQVELQELMVFQALAVQVELLAQVVFQEPLDLQEIVLFGKVDGLQVFYIIKMILLKPNIIHIFVK